jgi:tetratricopeptide (TPR) repeat protein
MRTAVEARISCVTRRRAWLLAAALVSSACATSGTTRPAKFEILDGQGFTITQEVHVGSGVRGDFESAMRLLEEEQYEKGIELLLKVTEAAPEVTAAHIDLGIAYARAGDLEHAEASLQRALELDPRHPVAYNELGIVYRRTGRFQEARESYEKALALYPDFHFARRNLAILCDLYLGDLSCAIEQYELYTKAVPEDETAAMWIADLRSRAGTQE